MFILMYEYSFVYVVVYVRVVGRVCASVHFCVRL